MTKEDNLSPVVAQMVLDEAIRLLQGGLGKWTEWGDETTDTQETAMRHLVRVGLFEGRRRVSIVDKTGEVLYSCCLRLHGEWDAAYRNVIRQYMPPAYLDETEEQYRPMIRGEGTGFHQVRRTREGELAAAADPQWVQQWIGEATKTGTKASVDVEQWQKHKANDGTGEGKPGGEVDPPPSTATGRAKAATKRGPQKTRDAKADLQLLKDWQRAKGTGTSRAEFARDRGITVADIEKARRNAGR